MKILMVSYSALPHMVNGVSNVIYNISKELNNRGNTIFVFSISNDVENTKEGSIITGENDAYSYISCVINRVSYEFGEDNYNNDFIKKAFIEYVQKVSPNIIHFHAMQHMGVNLIKIAKDMGKKTVLTMHDWWWICPRYFMTKKNKRCGQIQIDDYKCCECLEKDVIGEVEQYLEKRKLIFEECLENYVDKIICVSQFLKEYIIKNYPELKEKIEINENGMKINQLNLDSNPITKDKLVFGFVGGLSLEKGYDMVVKAFSKIDVNDYSLLIYNTPKIDKKECFKKIKNVFLEFKDIRDVFTKIVSWIKKFFILIKNKNNGNSIQYFHQYNINEINEVFKNFDVIIIASTVLESFSLVTREALLNNCVVLTSNCGGNSDIIIEGINGYTFEYDDYRDLERCIKYCIEHKEQVYAMKKNMFNSVKTIKTVVEQANELINIYEGIRN